MKLPGFFNNKYLYYALAVLAVLNVVGYVSVKAWECLAIFALTVYGAHHYSKNKSAAILAALFVSNFVFGCGRVKEGFQDAFKGPNELMTDAVDKIDQAADACASHTARKACSDAKDAAGNACVFTASDADIAADKEKDDDEGACAAGSA